MSDKALSHQDDTKRSTLQQLPNALLLVSLALTQVLQVLCACCDVWGQVFWVCRRVFSCLGLALDQLRLLSCDFLALVWLLHLLVLLRVFAFDANVALARAFFRAVGSRLSSALSGNPDLLNHLTATNSIAHIEALKTLPHTEQNPHFLPPHDTRSSLADLGARLHRPDLLSCRFPQNESQDQMKRQGRVGPSLQLQLEGKRMLV